MGDDWTLAEEREEPDKEGVESGVGEVTEDRKFGWFGLLAARPVGERLVVAGTTTTLALLDLVDL